MRGDAPGPLAWTAAAEASGERLDRHVAERLGEPRNQVQRWIREGWVRVNGRPARPSAAVAAGDAIACRPPARREERIAPRGRAARRALRGRRSRGPRQARRPDRPPRRRPGDRHPRPSPARPLPRDRRRRRGRAAGHRPPPGPGDERRPGGGADARRLRPALPRLRRARGRQALPGDRLRRARAPRRRHRGADRPPSHAAHGDGGAPGGPPGADPLSDARGRRRHRPPGARSRDRPHAPDPGAPEEPRPAAGGGPGLRRGALEGPAAQGPRPPARPFRARRSTPGASPSATRRPASRWLSRRRCPPISKRCGGRRRGRACRALPPGSGLVEDQD